MSYADTTGAPDRPVAACLLPVSVVTVLFNSAGVIEACLASVPKEAEVIVVDNASQDDGVARARRVRPDAVIVSSARNRGFGGGCNLGWARASRPNVAFVNPDVRLRPRALEVLLRRLSVEPHGIVGPALFDATGAPRRCKRRPSLWLDMANLLPAATRWIPADLSGKLDLEHPVHQAGGPVSHIEGACFVMRRADLDAIGGFDEDMFLYDEEESLALRLRRLGGRAVYEPAAEAEHAGADSTRLIGDVAVRHLYRSRVLLYRKRDGNLRGVIAAALLTVCGVTSLPAAVANLLLRRQRPRTLGRQWSVLRGILGGAVAAQGSDLAYRGVRN